jgi:beta-N-acetylhexosaminidase
VRSSPVRTALVVPVLVSGAMLAACAPAPAPSGPPVAGADRVLVPVVREAPEPACVPLPLERRAAAVLVVGLPEITSAGAPLATRVLRLGVGGVFLTESNVESQDQLRDLVDSLRTHAVAPLVVAADEESGRVSLLGALGEAGPSARRLAAEETPAQVRAYGRDVGEQLSDVGIDLDLAPVLDLDDGPYAGIIGDRSFSADPETAWSYARAFSQGLSDAGVIPTVKHFPGHGRSTTDTHVGGAVVDATLSQLQLRDLQPFQAAIDADAPVVMVNHVTYTALGTSRPASLNPRTYALLRDMGFEGVAMTDSLGMGSVNLRWDFPEAAVLAVEAGADALLVTDGAQAPRMRDALVQAVSSGRLDETRLSEAASRVTALAGGDPTTMLCPAQDAGRVLSRPPDAA